MAESGFFRVGFRGFNKQDVLKYIDEMQAASVHRLAQVDEQRRAAEAAVTDAQDQAREASMRAEQLEQDCETLRSQVEKLTVLAQLYKRQMLQLREQSEPQETVGENAALDAANERIAQLEERCALLVEQNARYAAIVGDVNRLVVEARVVSSSYFDVAQQKSTDCLKHLDMFLDDLKHQTQQAVENTDYRRRAGDTYMQTLLSELQELGNNID